MVQSEIKFLIKCTTCGAHMRPMSRYCPQCGIPLQQQDTKDLVEAVAEGIKEKKLALSDTELRTENDATQPLTSFAPKMLPQQEEAETAAALPYTQPEEDNAPIQEQTQIKESDASAKIAEDDGYWPMPETSAESLSKNETISITNNEDINTETVPILDGKNIKVETNQRAKSDSVKTDARTETIPLTNVEAVKADTVPIVTTKNKKSKSKSTTKNKGSANKQIAFEKLETVPVVQSKPAHTPAVDTGKQSQQVRAGQGQGHVLMKKAASPLAQVEKAFSISREFLETASPDPSVRFALVTIVLFFFFLITFFLSRYLR